MSEPVAVSVIITTYRDPDGLRLVLRALERQQRLPDEVLVADDGSPFDETAAMLRSVAATLPFPLVHVWQPDEGFRAARGRNNAVFQARGRFLAFLDQDTLPHPCWLAAHHDAVSSLQVGLGHVLELSEARDQRRTDGIRDPIAAASWHSPGEWRLLRALHRKFLFYAVLRRLGLAPANKPKLRSSNFSVHRSALDAVNGFDERYEGWGQEDDDLGRRLYRAGIRPVILLRHAPVSHRPHPPRRTEAWRDGPNLDLYRQPLRSFRCEQGLDRHPHADIKVTRWAAHAGESMSSKGECL